MKKLFLIYFIFCSFSLCAQQSTAYYDSLATIDSIAHLKHHHPLPLECSGIKAGSSNIFEYPFSYTQDKVSSIPLSDNLKDNAGLVGGIKFGDSVERVIKIYGHPNMDEKKDSVRTLVYEDDYERWPEVLFYSAKFEFENNKLRRITIYNGE
ncbi:MAG: hypothetical protein IPP38_14350 [Bacteroidetes bacterium]|nr:hypothetical protein [Bacteroidota bacterium]